jgi:ACT domain-containing protein
MVSAAEALIVPELPGDAVPTLARLLAAYADAPMDYAIVAHYTPMLGTSNRVIVTVIGADTVGIIAKVSAVLAAANANILDISQTTVREFFAMIMLADLADATVPFDELKRRLNAKGEEMGLKIEAQHEDVFKFMHRV